MTKPSDYKWIQRWGQLLGSYAPYVEDEQARAASVGAPLTAIYEKSCGGFRTGVWSTVDEIENNDVRERFLKLYKQDCPLEWWQPKKEAN